MFENFQEPILQLWLFSDKNKIRVKCERRVKETNNENQRREYKIKESHIQKKDMKKNSIRIIVVVGN